MPLYLKMSEKLDETMRHLKFCYISIFYKCSLDWHRNQWCENYIQLDQLKKTKRTKGLKRNIPLISTQKLSINENNLSQYSSKKK